MSAGIGAGIVWTGDFMKTETVVTNPMLRLRAEIATLKAAPFTGKASQAERTIDAALAVLVEQQQQIRQLTERLNRGN